MELKKERYCCCNMLKEFRERGFEPVKDAPKDTILPKRANKNDAGYDVFSPCDIHIPNGLSKTIWLNIKAYMPDNEYARIENRSSLMSKRDVMLFCSGIVDAGYYSNPDNDGNIGIRFLNFGAPYDVKKGDKICQIIFQEYKITDDDVASGERIGGFGSTGK